jgi:hypothetical protein
VKKIINCRETIKLDLENNKAITGFRAYQSPEYRFLSHQPVDRELFVVRRADGRLVVTGAGVILLVEGGGGGLGEL